MRTVAALCLAGLVMLGPAGARSFKVVYKDAVHLDALKEARDGNLYAAGSDGANGAIVQLTRDGALTELYDFKGGDDGSSPTGRLTEDTEGNLYGTTQQGGSAGCGGTGCGTVFKLAPDRSETVLQRFDGTDGARPFSHLERDKRGNLYGVAQQGGDTAACNGMGCGVVYKLAPDGTFSLLHTFTGGVDGGLPQSVMLDKRGDLYGAAWEGGVACRDWLPMGCGLIFEIAADGTFGAVHLFAGGDDGMMPGAFRMDAQGNVYGAVFYDGDPTGATNSRVVSIAPAGSVKVLLGAWAVNDAAFDRTGNLYATTASGGDPRCNCGSIFVLPAHGGPRIDLHLFGENDADSSFPATPLTVADDGWVWGTTEYGGHGNHGVVYKAKYKP